MIEVEGRELTSSSTDLDVQSVNAQFLAADCNILSSQHSSVWGGFVTVGLDLHASSHTSDGFAATGITQDVSLTIPLCAHKYISRTPTMCVSGVYVREIGNMDEGIVERCEDTGDAEDEFACAGSVSGGFLEDKRILPSLTWGPKEMFS